MIRAWPSLAPVPPAPCWRAFAARLLAAALLLAPAARAAAEQVEICYNYDCRVRTLVNFEPAALEPVRHILQNAADAAAEREGIAYAMGWMYFLAGQQSPIWRDRGGNYDDGDYLDGRMDCIDHSNNTTRFLQLLERRGWLRHHRVLAPVRRGRFLDLHWAGHVAERAGEDASGNAAGLRATGEPGTGIAREYAVDTWFFEPGHPAMVAPLRDWLRGVRPPGR